MFALLLFYVRVLFIVFGFSTAVRNVHKNIPQYLNMALFEQIHCSEFVICLFAKSEGKQNVWYLLRERLQ